MKTPARSYLRAVMHEAGAAAIALLTAGAWVLVALARAGRFDNWWIALPLVAGAAALGALAWLRLRWPDRVATAGLLLLSALLYLPPGEHLALSGDAAIYANEGAWIARTGGIESNYAPLAPLSPKARDLFYTSSEEQGVVRGGVTAYDGLVYRGYYVVDEAAPSIHASRPTQVSAWIAFGARLGGLPLGFYTSFAAAALSLCVLYAIGTRLFARWIALWMALLVALCYPQVYLARAPLAEITGQFWTLAGLWLAVRWLDEKRPWLLVLALLFWVTSWSARIDALLLLGPAGILLLVASFRRDRPALVAASVALPVYALLLYLGNNPPYVGSTLEITATYIDLLVPLLLAGLVCGPLLLMATWRWGKAMDGAWQRVHWPAKLLLAAGPLFVVLWATLPGPWRQADQTRTFQEIIWFSSAYVSPLFFWMALAGLLLILIRGRGAADFYLAAVAWILGAAYFYTYTSANQYPISMRRLVGDVIPLLALMAGYALALMPRIATRAPVRLIAQSALAAALLVWVVARTAPLLQQDEAAGDLEFVAGLHARLPAPGAFLFEPQDADSWVGWLAAPLYSLYGDWALLLESDTPDPAALALAAQEFEGVGRQVYLVSQSKPAPAALVPPGRTATPVLESNWVSSMIGQTRAPYPPPYWEFDLPIYVYRLDR